MSLSHSSPPLISNHVAKGKTCADSERSESVTHITRQRLAQCLHSAAFYFIHPLGLEEKREKRGDGMTRGGGEGLSWKNGSRDAERERRAAEPIILSLRVTGINENVILCKEIPQSQVTVSLQCIS